MLHATYPIFYLLHYAGRAAAAARADRPTVALVVLAVGQAPVAGVVIARAAQTTPGAEAKRSEGSTHQAANAAV